MPILNSFTTNTTLLYLSNLHQGQYRYTEDLLALENTAGAQAHPLSPTLHVHTCTTLKLGIWQEKLAIYNVYPDKVFAAFLLLRHLARIPHRYSTGLQAHPHISQPSVCVWSQRGSSAIPWPESPLRSNSMCSSADTAAMAAIGFQIGPWDWYQNVISPTNGASSITSQLQGREVPMMLSARSSAQSLIPLSMIRLALSAYWEQDVSWPSLT